MRKNQVLSTTNIRAGRARHSMQGVQGVLVDSGGRILTRDNYSRMIVALKQVFIYISFTILISSEKI